MILAILQARMSSTRLPGKVMMPLAGAAMIKLQIERIAASVRIADLVVAPSDQPSDDSPEAFLKSQDVKIFRGSLDNVQSRFLGAAEAYGPTADPSRKAQLAPSLARAPARVRQRITWPPPMTGPPSWANSTFTSMNRAIHNSRGSNSRALTESSLN